MSRAKQVLSQFKKNQRIMDLNADEEKIREKNLDTLNEVMNSLGKAQNRASELQQALRERDQPGSAKKDILEALDEAYRSVNKIEEKTDGRPY